MPRPVLIVHNGHEITAESQASCLVVLHSARAMGRTAQEIEKITGKSHGTISGALSHLQEEGMVAQLEKRRGKYRIYVLSEHVDNRPTVARYHFKANAEQVEALEARVLILTEFLDQELPGWPEKLAGKRPLPGL